MSCDAASLMEMEQNSHFSVQSKKKSMRIGKIPNSNSNNNKAEEKKIIKCRRKPGATEDFKKEMREILESIAMQINSANMKSV